MKPAAQQKGDRIEAVILSVKDTAARCRILSSGESITLRTGGVWELVPGEIATVRTRKRRIYGGNPYLSGEIESTRLDAGALDLIPLKLAECGVWDPAEHYWGDDGEPVDEWAKPIIARGCRQQFEMEQILPGADYEAGVRIGELSFGLQFDGLLPWGWIDNRPFLRCMSGFGLCLWRLKRFDEAYRIFDRMLWLNPSDNQGVRLLLHQVRNKETWSASEDR